jgi:alpha-tubulin suppressor-like RCC1 family protein
VIYESLKIKAIIDKSCLLSQITLFLFPFSFNTDSSQVFYAGKDIFPFNAKIDSLSGVFQHEITATSVELKEFERLNDKFDMIRAGDEHFVLLNETRDKLYGWGFNSHYQLADINSANILMYPDVFFQADLDETIKLLECGKLSTCLVTGMSELM